jgi:preprotein translocase subunit YajC
MLDWLIGVAHAAGEAAPAPAAPAGPGGIFGRGDLTSMIPFILLMVVMYYFLLYLPQRKRQRERDTLLTNMKRGDEVVTAGGIYGKVTGITDQSVNLEIAPKVRIKVTKGSIASVVAQSSGEEENKE